MVLLKPTALGSAKGVTEDARAAAGVDGVVKDLVRGRPSLSGPSGLLLAFRLPLGAIGLISVRGRPSLSGPSGLLLALRFPLGAIGLISSNGSASGRRIRGPLIQTYPLCWLCIPTAPVSCVPSNVFLRQALGL